MDEHTLVEWKVCHTVLQNSGQGAKDAQLGAMAMVLALALDATWLRLTPSKKVGHPWEVRTLPRTLCQT